MFELSDSTAGGGDVVGQESEFIFSLGQEAGILWIFSLVEEKFAGCEPT